MRRMELLYEKFYVKLYLYALTFIGNEDDAKDIVSDVFQQIWEQWKQAEDNTAPPGASFLYISVRNKCLDKLRHERVAGKYVEALKASACIICDDDVPEFEARIQRIHDAISKLPEPGQTVLKHTYFKNMTYKQTAKMLGMSENMVHKHMLRMFRLLREMLK